MTGQCIVWPSICAFAPAWRLGSDRFRVSYYDDRFRSCRLNEAVFSAVTSVVGEIKEMDGRHIGDLTSTSPFNPVTFLTFIMVSRKHNRNDAHGRTFHQPTYRSRERRGLLALRLAQPRRRLLPRVHLTAQQSRILTSRPFDPMMMEFVRRPTVVAMPRVPARDLRPMCLLTDKA